jgi:hypothetical protein
VRLLGAPYVEGGSIVSDYAWAVDGHRAGRIMLHATHGEITRLVITFEPPVPS